MPAPEKLMAVAAASWVLDLPKARVEQTIEEGSLPRTILIKKDGRIFFAARSLPYVKFSASTRTRFSKQYRADVLNRMTIGKTLVLRDAVNATSVDLKDYWREISGRVKQWAEAEKAVTSDPEILDGERCLRGTRIPVYMIADMLAAGDSPTAIVANYPSLTLKTIEMARIYAAANPKRGRPPKPSWRKSASVKKAIIRRSAVLG